MRRQHLLWLIRRVFALQLPCGTVRAFGLSFITLLKDERTFSQEMIAMVGITYFDLLLLASQASSPRLLMRPFAHEARATPWHGKTMMRQYDTGCS